MEENAIYFFLSLDGQDDPRPSHYGVQYLQLLRYLNSKGCSIAVLNSLEFTSSKVNYHRLQYSHLSNFEAQTRY